MSATTTRVQHALINYQQHQCLYSLLTSFSQRKAAQLQGKQADQLACAAIDLLLPYQDKVHTITVDNGKEFASHQRMSEELKPDIYFAHPYHSWDRGLN